MAMLAARGWYRQRLTVRILDDLRLGVTAISIAAMVVLSVRVVATGDAAVAPQMVRLWAFGAFLLVGGRATLALSEVWARRQTEALQNTLIVGAGTVGRLTANRLLGAPGARAAARRVPGQESPRGRGRLGGPARPRGELGPGRGDPTP